jgi:hypothetical protein
VLNCPHDLQFERSHSRRNVPRPRRFGVRANGHLHRHP